MTFQPLINQITDRVIDSLEEAPFYQRTDEDRLKAVGNIYFIYSNGKLKYIGQRQAKSLRTRLGNHLFGRAFREDDNGKQIGTVSKWHLVKKEIDQNNTITFKSVLIEPDSLRTTIELELIKRLKPKWNIQGK